MKSRPFASGPGFTLGVSSTPCTGTEVCGGTVCKTITRKSELDGMDVPTVDCPWNTVGRFVYIQLLGPRRLLNFREMQVALTGPHLAFLKGYTASMQSQYGNYVPSNGVDGSFKNLAHSRVGTNVWWQVDLGADRVVSQIKLHNRVPSQCGWRILSGYGCSSVSSGPGFTLGVSSTPCTGTKVCGGTVCTTITRKSELDGMHVPVVSCPANTVGRFVYVQLLGSKRMLNIDEMQVAFTNYTDTGPALVSVLQAKDLKVTFKATDMSEKFQCDPVDRDVTDAACYGDRYAALKAELYTV